MEREADRMVNLQFTDEQVKAEVGVVQNERRGNENSPGYLLGEKIWATLFPGHPYSRSVIGTVPQIATLDRAKSLAYYKRYYAPNNAVLVVAGDVTEAEVRTLAESTFGRIPANKDLPPRVVQPVPVKPATLRVDFEHERVASSSISFLYSLPGTGGLSAADTTALNVLAYVVGKDYIGRLFGALVAEQKLAIGISAGSWLALRGGILSFEATAAPGVSVADMEAALGRQITALVRDGVTVAEVEAAKKAFLASKAYLDDNHRSLASDYGASLSRGLTVADVENLLAFAERVTADDVNRVIARFMAKAEPVVVVMRPKAPADESKFAGPPK
jgi:zinc protease